MEQIQNSKHPHLIIMLDKFLYSFFILMQHAKCQRNIVVANIFHPETNKIINKINTIRLIF
jgi:hypothetical protein